MVRLFSEVISKPSHHDTVGRGMSERLQQTQSSQGDFRGNGLAVTALQSVEKVQIGIVHETGDMVVCDARCALVAG